jgi:hypothetical protein
VVVVTVQLWIVLVLAAVALSVIIAVEETRVSEAHREAESWQKRTCHHGSSTFAPFDGDEVDR